MSIATNISKQVSLAEFLNLPETKPASEYINGEIYQKPMPQGKHSILQGKLLTAINQIGQPQKLAYAFPELRSTFDERSLVPDIAVFEWQRIPFDANGEIENRFTIAPDWIIEILSPEQNPIRVIDKILFCLDRNSKLGWLIDPQERIVMVFIQGKQPIIKQKNDSLPVLEIFSPWQLSVNDLFSWLSLI